MGIFRILHFSDVHAGLVDFHAGYLLDKRFFGRLNQFCRRQMSLSLDNIGRLAELHRARHIDFTICTGDLTSIGSPGEFDHAIGLLEPILEAAGDAFLFVPGNHDAYVRQNADALRQAFRRLNPACPAALDGLPAVVDCGVAEIVAANAARPCRIWQSTGQMTPDAWQRLDYILSRPRRPAKARLLACHFPLIGHDARPLSWRTKLIEGDRHLMEAIASRRLDAMLTGHVHYPFIHPLGAAGCLAVGAGSLTIRNSCAIVSIDTVSGKTTAEIINFQPESQ